MYMTPKPLRKPGSRLKTQKHWPKKKRNVRYVKYDKGNLFIWKGPRSYGRDLGI